MYDFEYFRGLKRRRERLRMFVYFLLACCVIVLVLALGNMGSCSTDDSEALRAAEMFGFKDVHINERGYFGTQWEGCGQSDGAYYKATATNSTGGSVSILICCGGPMRMKGCTVRSQ